MKLIIQIPCFNEEEVLALTLSALPRTLEGFEKVEWLVIDDGRKDATVEVAKKNGADYVVSHYGNKGLARAFMTGLEFSLNHDADVIVNTDADNRIVLDDIVKLLEPILSHRAEFVIGARPISAIEHFSFIKKILQRIGSWVVRVASNTSVPDAPSGFRAISRSAARQLTVFNEYTYTLETIIQAGQKNIAIESVPVRVNDELRPSRLVKSIPSYIKKSIFTILRIFVIYRPFQFFASIGLSMIIAGVIIGIFFLKEFFYGHGDGHVQSLILSAIFLIVGFQTILVAFISDLLAANRKLVEDVRTKIFASTPAFSAGKVWYKNKYAEASTQKDIQ